MAGFNRYKDIIKSWQDDGMYSHNSFRKVVSNATASGIWCDLSYSPGNPSPNFYASEPLVSSTLESTKGIDNGGDVAPARKFLKNFLIYSTSTATNQSSYVLCDYLLYYPFIDGDSSEEQTLTNSVTLPRYVSGEGVKAFVVAQGAYVGGATISINYTNSTGTPNRTSPATITNTTTFASCIIHRGPFLPLQSTDTGIRSVESVTLSAPNGGIYALVLAKPLAAISLEEVTATLNTPSYQSYLGDITASPEIKDGAYLNLIACGNASLSGAVVQGMLNFIWR